MSFINWFHVSDLHIKKNTAWFNQEAAIQNRLVGKYKPNFLIVTGDFRHHKYNDSFADAKEWLEKFIELFGIPKSNVFFVPGNHDVNISNPSYRKPVIKEIKAQFKAGNIEDYNLYMDETLIPAFSEYKAFVQDFYAGEVTDARVSSPASVYTVEWDNKINIIGINTALGCTGNRENENREFFDTNNLCSLNINKDLPSIILAHHAHDDVFTGQFKNSKEKLDSYHVCAYLCGDRHKAEKSYLSLNKPIPCYVCPKESADNSDDYSDTGILYYSWNLEDKHVEVKSIMYENGSWKDTTDLSEEGFQLSVEVSKPNLQSIPTETTKETQSPPKSIKTRDVGQLLSTNPYSRDFKCEYPELFYDYSDEKITKKCVKIECQTYAGDMLRPISECVYSQKIEEEKSLDDWIQQYWVNDTEKRIHLLSGYAGCGKSTFVLHQIERNGLNAHVITFMDARQQLQEVTTSEAVILLKNLLRDLCIKMINYHTSNGNLDKCINNLRENLEQWGYELTTDAYAFKAEINQFFIDFSSKTSKSRDYSRGIYLEIDKFINSWLEGILDCKPFDIDYNKKCSDCIPLVLSMLVLWYHTMSQLETAESSENHIWLVFDNLDEFDDKQQIVDLIMHVNTVLHNYYVFCPNDGIQPVIFIDAIFTCRMFTLADLLNKKGGLIDKTFLTQICISGLYSVSEVMKYKAKGIVSSNTTMSKLSVNSSSKKQLETISGFPTSFFRYIDSTNEFDAVSVSRIINHNLRSAAAVFKKLSEDRFFNDKETREYINHLLNKSSESGTIDRRLNGYLIHRLSSYLLNVWSDMGYRTATNKPQNPTTLSRLILTALFRKNKKDNANPQYSLRELYNKLKWIPISKNTSPEPNDLPVEIFADTIARMLTRNIGNSDMGPDSYIWRRPIMFHKNVISVTGIRERSERVKRYKEEIIDQINNPDIDCAEIVITDCGEEFIASYAIHFEFNSARFNPSYGPLWTISDYNEMDIVINGVHTEVRNCMIKQKDLAEAFRTKKPNDKYLSEEIHPLTNSFSTVPRPQPHILRVIFEHIAYLEYIRKTLWEETTNKKEVTDRIKTLNKWIGKYIYLLYQKLDNKTILESLNSTNDSNIADKLVKSYRYVVQNVTEDNPYVSEIQAKK